MKYLIHVYILELQDGYYYVGRTKDIDARLKKHFKGKGSAWTILHPPVECLGHESFLVSSKEEEDKWENFITIKLMRDKGWNKVRGGFWCNVGEIEVLKNLNAHGYFLDIDTETIHLESRTIYVYLLELEQGKYFAGYTRLLKNALKSHDKGKGSHWTKKYRPVNLIDYQEIIFEGGIINIDTIDTIVLKYGEKYGYENIRGGHFVSVDEERHLQHINISLSKQNLKEEKHPLVSLKYSKLLTEYENHYGFIDFDLSIEENEAIWMIYILKLTDNYYQISAAKDLNSLLRKYENGKCSRWCTLHTPLKLEKVIPVIGEKKCLDIEIIDPIVESYFDTYGAKQIRGGRFTLVDESRHLEKVDERYYTVDGKYYLRDRFKHMGSHKL